MGKHLKVLAMACAAVFAAIAITACSGGVEENVEQDSSSEETATQVTFTRDEVESVLDDAASIDYSNITFSMETEVTATGTSQNQLQQQTMITTMKGKFDKAQDAPALYISYKSSSNVQLGVTTYEMFIDDENGLIVRQNDQLFVEDLGEDDAEAYIDSLISIVSKEQIDALLDVSSKYDIKEDGDGGTTVSLTVDRDKIADSSLVDTSALPDNSGASTLVASYNIGEDGRFKSVHLMSSTSGSPTYRVRQSYTFSDYNVTTLPEWPDLQAYMMEMSGIEVDEFGNMYIDEDGIRYYIDSIDEDGTINFRPTETTDYTGSDDTVYYYYDDNGAETTTNSGSTSTNPGRPYITADDGSIIYLDEEGLAEVGGRLIDSGNGTYALLTEDGGFYYLGEVDL